MRIRNNKILITGATQGIGRAMALAFAKLDNTVIAVGRDAQKLQQLTTLTGKIIPFSCDLSKPEELERLAVFIKERHDDLNVLINNAGIQYNYDFSKEVSPLEKIDHELSVNLSAPIKLTALLIPVLQVQENAAIVNVSSGLGLVPKMQAPVYCATKAAVHIFSKALRYQLKTVKVFEIIPPLVDTRMTQGRGSGKISPDALVDEFLRAFQRNRFEVNIGKVKLLRIINRIAPALADRIMRGR